MRKIYYDLEFLEGKQDERIFGIKTGRKTKPTIDIISLGMVDGDGREYYAISKDFNLKEAWNRYDIKTEQVYGDQRNIFPDGKKTKVYWIRENVLKPIYQELLYSGYVKAGLPIPEIKQGMFTYKNLKTLINHFGKSNQEISQDVERFCLIEKKIDGSPETGTVIEVHSECNLYGYYSSYDHVALCWLFGKMIDLPKGFPMYTIDLKQKLDDLAKSESDISGTSFKESLANIKEMQDYPKQENEHNALADARWNKKMHDFLNSII